MIRKLSIVVLALCLAAGGLSACQTKPKNEMVINVGPDGRMTVQSNGSPEDQAIAALLQAELDKQADAKALTEDEVWRKDADGNLTHIQSGVQCPAVWGNYTRGKVTIFRPDGMDVGCNYNSPNATLTFYAYKSDLKLADELKGTMETVKMRQPVSKEVPFSLPSSNDGYVAATLSYKDANGREERTSTLLANGGTWRLKIRLTCRADVAKDIENGAAVAMMGQRDRMLNPPPAPQQAPPI